MVVGCLPSINACGVMRVVVFSRLSPPESGPNPRKRNRGRAFSEAADISKLSMAYEIISISLRGYLPSKSSHCFLDRPRAARLRGGGGCSVRDVVYNPVGSLVGSACFGNFNHVSRQLQVQITCQKMDVSL